MCATFVESNMRIALLEDDPFQSEVIVQILSQSGHDVVTFVDGVRGCSTRVEGVGWHGCLPVVCAGPPVESSGG